MAFAAYTFIPDVGVTLDVRLHSSVTSTSTSVHAVMTSAFNSILSQLDELKFAIVNRQDTSIRGLGTLSW